MLDHFGVDACGVDWGRNHRKGRMEVIIIEVNFNVHVVAPPFTLIASFTCVHKSAKDIRPQFAKLRKDLRPVQLVHCGNGCHLPLPDSMKQAFLSLSPSPLSLSAPSGIILFISRILSAFCLFISHCFQAQSALF